MEARLRTPWRVRGAPKKPLDGTGAWMGHTNGVHLWQLFQFHPLYLQVPCTWVYDLPQKNRSSSSFMGMLQVSSPLTFHRASGGAPAGGAESQRTKIRAKGSSCAGPSTVPMEPVGTGARRS